MTSVLPRTLTTSIWEFPTFGLGGSLPIWFKTSGFQKRVSLYTATSAKGNVAGSSGFSTGGVGTVSTTGGALVVGGQSVLGTTGIWASGRFGLRRFGRGEATGTSKDSNRQGRHEMAETKRFMG